MKTDLINKDMFRASGFRNKPIFTGKSLPKNKTKQKDKITGKYWFMRRTEFVSEFPVFLGMFHFYLLCLIDVF